MKSSAAGFNFFPLQTLYKMYYYPSPLFATVNVIGNITLLIPLGIFLPLVFQHLNKFWKVFIVGIILVIIIEVLQYYYLAGLRTADIDDVILNVMGISAGYGVLYFIAQKNS